MKKTLILLFLLLFTFSFSQQWNLVAESNSNTFYYKPNTDDTAWIKVVSDKLEYFNDKTGKKLIVKGYQLVLWKYDCKGKKLGMLQMNTYSKQGKLLSSMDINEYLMEMEYVTPDSVGEEFLKAFCIFNN